MNPINRNYYIKLKQKNHRTGARPCDNKQGKDNARLIIESNELSYHMGKHLHSLTLAEAVDWILGFHMYSEDTVTSYTGKYSTTPNIGRGKIVTFDSFGQVGTEQKKNRPAIILRESYHGVIVAPISSSAYNSGKPYHIKLDRKVKQHGEMTNNCGIKLDQIRYIDKGRISSLGGKVIDRVKINEIDEALVQYFAPKFYKKYNQLEADKAQLETDKTQLESDNTQLEADKVTLQSKNAQLEADNEQLNGQLVALEASLLEKEDAFKALERKYTIAQAELEGYKQSVRKDGA